MRCPRFRIGHAAAAHSGCRLVRIRRTAVAAVRRPVSVRVHRIVEARTDVDAIGNAVTVGVRISHAAAAHTGRRLVRIRRTAVAAVRRPVTIRVSRVVEAGADIATVRYTVGIRIQVVVEARTDIASITKPVGVGVRLAGVRCVQTVIDVVADTITVRVTDTGARTGVGCEVHVDVPFVHPQLVPVTTGRLGVIARDAEVGTLHHGLGQGTSPSVGSS